MQSLAVSQMIFSLTLAGLFFFGIAYAFLVRWMADRKVEGQTAYVVIGGVAVALIGSIFTIGLVNMAILFAYFSACGLPMVVEYTDRVHKQRRTDLENAEALAKEVLNHDGQT